MPLPNDFSFSASNLQDYLDCPLRFELRYVRKLEWPALQSEPVIEQEQRIERGNRFHLMVYRSLIGLPDEDINPEVEPDLSRWWNSFRISQVIEELPSQRFAETSLISSINGSRLLAKFDLIALSPGERSVIVDWKTSTHRPARTALLNRVQTLLYPWMLVKAGARLNGGVPISPDQLEMIYWFPDFPDQPEIVPHSAAQQEKTDKYICNLLSEIKNHKDDSFLMTLDEKKCQFCNYRSYCNRGQSAGDWDGEETGAGTSPIDLDFESIEELNI